jgi:6-phosphogluconolactonase
VKLNVFRGFLGLSLLIALATPMLAKSYRVYVGTYTRDKVSEGIYTMTFDSATGKLSDPVLAAPATNPSFLTVHPNGKWLYSVTEAAGPDAGTVTAFSIDSATGKLTELNQTKSKGSMPCYVSVDSTGKYVFVANYGSGSIAALPIQPDGKLGEATGFMQHEGTGPNAARQKGPHAHSIKQYPKTNFVMAADLGTDKLTAYRFDATKGGFTAIKPAELAPGAGPRHFAFHPKRNVIYVNGEMGSTVTAFGFNPKDGTFTTLGSLTTLPADHQGENNTAETVVHPSGKFVYVSNRGNDSLAVFSVNSDGTLKAVGHVKSGGQIPRNFNIDPTGNYLLAGNQRTNNLLVFKIDPKSGMLTPTGQELKIGAPVCIRFFPAR